MDGVQRPQGYSHFEEAVYFLPLLQILWFWFKYRDIKKNFCDLLWVKNAWNHLILSENIVDTHYKKQN